MKANNVDTLDDKEVFIARDSKLASKWSLSSLRDRSMEKSLI